MENYENETATVNTERKNTEGMELYDWLQCIITAIIAAILIFMFVFRVITVEGSSMNHTLVDRDMLIVSKLFYTPKYGDIVILRATDYGPTPLVKRVIATEGQTVDIDFDLGVVYVDGVMLDEPYTATPTNIHEDFTEPLTVPENCVFVMGDNRNGSTDSRTTEIGMVDLREIIGKAYFLLLPGADETHPRDFKRIGSLADGRMA